MTARIRLLVNQKPWCSTAAKQPRPFSTVQSPGKIRRQALKKSKIISNLFHPLFPDDPSFILAFWQMKPLRDFSWVFFPVLFPTCCRARNLLYLSWYGKARLSYNPLNPPSAGLWGPIGLQVILIPVRAHQPREATDPVAWQGGEVALVAIFGLSRFILSFCGTNWPFWKQFSFKMIAFSFEKDLRCIT